MRKHFKGIFMAIPLVIILCSMSALDDSGDTYWYVNGQRYYWFFQPDVFAFRTTDGSAFADDLDSSCVAYHFHRLLHRDKLNIIYFKSDCGLSQREQVKNVIRSKQNFQTEFPVVTLFPELSYASAAWYVLDDQLLVGFRKDSIDLNSVQSFMSKYQLQPVNFSDSTATEPRFTYIFQYRTQYDNAIELAKLIHQQDSGLVKNVQPNLIAAYKEITDETIAANPQTVTDDLEYHLLHQQNKSIQLFVQMNGQVRFARVKIYDLFGREIYSNSIDSDRKKLEINIKDYVIGTYFACIETVSGEVLGVQKFMKW